MSYTLIGILILLNIFIIIRKSRKSKQSKQYDDMIEIFTDPKIKRPTLEFGSSYGWPTFSVTFANRDDYEYAKENKLFEIFKSRISSYYNSKFDADSAIEFRFPGMTVIVGGVDLEV